MDGGFLSDRDLHRALAEQRDTNELLGQILVRMGVLDPVEIAAALSVQGHIENLEDAVRSAAGTRQMLGAMLVMAGRITSGQLEQAIAVQKFTGEKLGEVFTRLGILKEEQLNNLLTYQRNQDDGKVEPSPFRLGEILICAGYITREQLDEALQQQSSSSKRLGEVLVENGYATPHHVSHALHLQQKLVTVALAAVLALSELSLSGCGGGGAGAPEASPPATSSAVQQAGSTAQFSVSSDDYPLAAPTFYYSTINDSFWSIQANIARFVQDIDTRCVIRIDVPRVNGNWPSLNSVFSIEELPGVQRFPGTVLVFNGSASTMSRVESGTISFSPDSVATGRVKGSFNVTMTDYGAVSQPLPQHHIKGSFDFRMGDYRPADPA